jgi:hypothetical protein
LTLRCLLLSMIRNELSFTCLGKGITINKSGKK